ncbi:hypothetical protein BN1110_06459 [bacterium YEK0313]|nr:hypothetical protein BN1110_06459 [bacterium YEK0313]
MNERRSSGSAARAAGRAWEVAARARSEPGRQNLVAVVAQEHEGRIGPRADIVGAHRFRRRAVIPRGRQGRQVRAQYQPQGKGNDARSSSTSRP